MKRFLLAIIISICTFNVNAQSLETFKVDFTKILSKNSSKDDVGSFFKKHEKLLNPHDEGMQLIASLKGDHISAYPLEQFKNDKLYINNIQTLLNSEKPHDRIMAYAIVASAGDKSFEDLLVQKIKTEIDEYCIMRAGMALLYMKSSQTTAIFDFLVEHEDFGDAHMLPMYIALDKDSIKQTAYRSITSSNPKARILAVQSLAYTDLNAKTEALITNAIRDWQHDEKGYAIFSAMELGVGNLLPILKPLLDSVNTRRISLEALANSPSDDDQQYLRQLMEESDSPSEELLNTFVGSKRVENVKYWLTLLQTVQLPTDYYFSIHDQPLLFSDPLLPDIYSALDKVTNTETLSELIRSLSERRDDRSTNKLLVFLDHDSSDVRYWAAKSLENNKAPQLVAKIPSLLADPQKRTVALTDLAIENDLDTLQSLYENILMSETDNDWQRSSVEYLSIFPRENHKELFRKILQTKDIDFFIKRSATLGLGTLKDESSVDLIILACREESKGSDYNAGPYISALGMIKTKKAKKEIEKYKNSEEETIKELATSILNDW